MTDQPAAGPQCDICQQEPAVMSEMDLSDYSTVMVGLGCLGGFYTEMAANLKPAADSQPAEPVTPAPAETPTAPPETPASDGKPAPSGPAKAASGPRKTRSRR